MYKKNYGRISLFAYSTALKKSEFLNYGNSLLQGYPIGYNTRRNKFPKMEQKFVVEWHCSATACVYKKAISCSIAKIYGRIIVFFVTVLHIQESVKYTRKW